MSIFYIKRNDTAPSIQLALRDEEGNAIDLTDAIAVRFHMKGQSAQQPKIDGGSLVVTNVVGGVCRYDWTAADTDTAGKFNAEAEIEWSDNRIQTVPKAGYATVQITEDLA